MTCVVSLQSPDQIANSECTASGSGFGSDPGLGLGAVSTQGDGKPRMTCKGGRGGDVERSGGVVGVVVGICQASRRRNHRESCSLRRHRRMRTKRRTEPIDMKKPKVAAEDIMYWLRVATTPRGPGPALRSVSLYCPPPPPCPLLVRCPFADGALSASAVTSAAKRRARVHHLRLQVPRGRCSAGKNELTA